MPVGQFSPWTQVCRAALLAGLLLPAPWGGAAGKADPLFQSDDVLPVTLQGPLQRISRDRREDPPAEDGQLIYEDAPGRRVVLDVGLTPRGKSRRDREVCTFPPLWLRFEREQVKDTLFEKQKRLKLVTYCRSPKSFQDYVIKEYLVYRIFNQLSDASFRVRLLKIAFDDSESKREPMLRYGFLIEHKKRLAKRLGRKVVEPAERIAAGALDPGQAAIAELFQFMVSNTDFSFIAPPVDDACCHNTVLFDGGNGRYLPVPYDFDRTGLVNPPNGVPSEGLGQRSLRDRVYRGFCRDPKYLDDAIRKTLDARQRIENLVRDQVALSERARKGALDYLAGYYAIITNPARRERALRCRPVP